MKANHAVLVLAKRSHNRSYTMHGNLTLHIANAEDFLFLDLDYVHNAN